MDLINFDIHSRLLVLEKKRYDKFLTNYSSQQAPCTKLWLSAMHFSYYDICMHALHISADCLMITYMLPNSPIESRRRLHQWSPRIHHRHIPTSRPCRTPGRYPHRDQSPLPVGRHRRWYSWHLLYQLQLTERDLLKRNNRTD